MESHDFGVHRVEISYAMCWSFAGVFFKFGGKLTNYNNILMSKDLYSQ